MGSFYWFLDFFGLAKCDSPCLGDRQIWARSVAFRGVGRTKVRRAPKTAVEKVHQNWIISKKFNITVSHLRSLCFKWFFLFIPWLFRSCQMWQPLLLILYYAQPWSSKIALIKNTDFFVPWWYKSLFSHIFPSFFRFIFIKSAAFFFSK